MDDLGAGGDVRGQGHLDGPAPDRGEQAGGQEHQGVQVAARCGVADRALLLGFAEHARRGVDEDPSPPVPVVEAPSAHQAHLGPVLTDEVLRTGDALDGAQRGHHPERVTVEQRRAHTPAPCGQLVRPDIGSA